MRVFLLILFLSGSASAAAAKPLSAFEAMKLLPMEDAKRLALIVGCEGEPTPARWHFLVYDEKAENGYREYVVADQKLIMQREFSQFATEIRAADALADQPIEWDSSQIEEITRGYVLANKSEVHAVNYELRKAATEETAVWKVLCMNKEREPIGSLVISATEGKVLAHQGFPQEPSAMMAKAPKTKNSTKKTTTAGTAKKSRAGSAVARSEVWETPPDVVAAAPERASRITVKRAQPVYRSTQRRVAGVERTAAPVRRVVRGILPF